MDFDLNTMQIATVNQYTIQDNKIEILVNPDNLSFEVTGFDQNRDLRVKASAAKKAPKGWGR